MKKENETIVLLGGPHIQFVTPLEDEDGPYCILKAVVPPGVVVPIHSHKDRETFFILTGELQGLNDKTWQTLRGGDIFDVPSGLRHAWRNAGSETASLLVVTTLNMGRFFRDIGRPLADARPGPPGPDELQRFIRSSIERGYWLGDPDDNAAVGISMGPPGG